MKKVLLLAVLVSFGFISQAQLRYNFFVGQDAELMQTTFNGFGSVGWDFTHTRYKSFGEGSTKGFWAIGGGLTVRKFRFKNNFALEGSGEAVVFVPDSSHRDYTQSFFSYSKSKLVTTYIRVHPEIGISFNNEKFAIGVGPILDFLIQTKHKRKYKVDGEKEKFVNRSNDEYDVNRFQYGGRLTVGGMKFGAYMVYMVNPFFANPLSPQVNSMETGFYLRQAIGD